MSLVIERYGDVTRIRMASLGSRAFKLDVSAYVVRGILVDSGFHHARRPFTDAIESIGVRGCIVTHWHEDHSGNAVLLARRGVPLKLRADTERILRRRPAIALYRRVTWGRPPALDVSLVAFDLDGLECIPTPGHSEDHQVVWDSSTETLFSGDLWLGVRARSVHPSENPYVLLDSLRRVAALRPRRMFDAHRGLVDRATAAIERKIQWLGDAVATIEDRIAEGWNDRAITKELGGDGWLGVATEGEYTTTNLVRAVRRDRPA
jgi:glyoxylase-like metal-dependent hydrolase (beta-lactamase superfamily II)